jgi:diketogulonate reductase-like aldo/keto reductase
MDKTEGHCCCNVIVFLIFAVSNTDESFIRTTTKESRMREYLSVIDLPDLTPEDMAAVDEAAIKHHYRRYFHSLYNEVKQ